MKIFKRTIIFALASCMLLCGCKKVLNFEEYSADIGFCITGNGAYETFSDKISLEKVSDKGEWREFTFTVKSDLEEIINDLYIVSLQKDVAVDDISIKTADSQEKIIFTDYFENIKPIKEAYGWEIDDKVFLSGNKSLRALGESYKLLYMISDGTKADEFSESEYYMQQYEEFKVSICVKFDWNPDNYNKLFYLGINMAE